MIAVADAGPIIRLSWLERLELLDALFHGVIVPEAVYRELLPVGRNVPAGDALLAAFRAGWLRVQPVRDEVRVIALATAVDRGEAEALILCQEMQAALLLVDDRRARNEAERLGLRFTGTIGVLREARRQGLLQAVYPLLMDLRVLGFWISEALLEEARRDDG